MFIAGLLYKELLYKIGMGFSCCSPHLGLILRFMIGGGSATVLNLSLSYFRVELLGSGSDLQQNYVNFATMELA